MANIASAEKRNRQRQRRRARNVAHLSKLRSFVKKVETALAQKDKKLPAVLKEAVQVIDKAAQRGVIKKEAAARKISRLTKRVNAVAAPAARK